jgi:hypothetical protein
VGFILARRLAGCVPQGIESHALDHVCEFTDGPFGDVLRRRAVPVDENYGQLSHGF